MRKELLKGLTEEQVAKVKACKSTDEILNVAKEEGVELTDEQLEAVSGGGRCSNDECPYCLGEGHQIGDDLWECYRCKGRYNGMKW